MHAFAGALLTVQRGLAGVITPEVLAVHMSGGPGGFHVQVHHEPTLPEGAKRRLTEAMFEQVFERALALRG